ncbi:hypothetical protein [Streptomyces sp. NPDC012510]|uniref:hypothetical protein n=1 Tax=Streptomyces sp. NPDC012510 TaxID=3364838 RepID=UPI0036E89689
MTDPEAWRTDPRERLLAAIDRTWARSELGATPEQLVDEYADHLADRVRTYPRAEKPACRTSQHCAYHGWCHRCDPERAGMDRAARLISRKGGEQR